MDWGRNTGPRRDIDERPVLHKGRVEGDKGVVLEAGVAGQMRFHAAAIGADGLRQAPHDDTLRERLERGKLWRVMTVHEHQPGTRHLPTAGAYKHIVPQCFARMTGRRERDLGKRGHVGVLPGLLPRAREAYGGEAGERGLADPLGPRRPVAGVAG